MLPVAAHTADTPIQVTLDASKRGAVIDRHVFGQFAEHLGSGIYTSCINCLRSLRVGVPACRSEVPQEDFLLGASREAGHLFRHSELRDLRRSYGVVQDGFR